MLTGLASGRSIRDERGIVGANLVIVLAFALYAVIQLSRTTIAANQIDARVKIINSEIGPGSTGVSHLDEVARLDVIGDLAESINNSAKPLSGQAGQVIDITHSIDGTASQIQDVVHGINGTVKDIGNNARDINATVHAINGNAAQIQSVVRSIHDGVAAINGRADKAIPIVRGIREDLANVLAQVGGGGPGGHTGAGGLTISGHANSIDCKLPLGHACGQ